jgi:predicted transposase/invertase (TIGR01784 family)
MTKKAMLSPKNDFIFKLIFGDQRNADVLASFLQAVLDLPESEYEEIVIVDPHLKRESAEDKLGVLDVKIRTHSGKVVEVEIQIQETPQMRERIVYYASKMIAEQIGKGDGYGAIKKVVSIIITDYELIKENGKYHNRYRLYDKESCSEFTDILEVNTLELPKLPKDGDRTELFDWLLFLKTERGEELEMLAEKNPKIKKAVGILKELSEDERTRLLCEAREKARRDEAARLAGAREWGLAEGRAEVAKKALKIGLPVEDIIVITGFSREEIEKLRS